MSHKWVQISACIPTYHETAYFQLSTALPPPERSIWRRIIITRACKRNSSGSTIPIILLSCFCIESRFKNFVTENCFFTASFTQRSWRTNTQAVLYTYCKIQKLQFNRYFPQRRHCVTNRPNDPCILYAYNMHNICNILCTIICIYLRHKMKHQFSITSWTSHDSLILVVSTLIEIWHDDLSIFVTLNRKWANLSEIFIGKYSQFRDFRKALNICLPISLWGASIRFISLQIFIKNRIGVPLMYLRLKSDNYWRF